MHVQYFYSFARDSVKDFVRIPNERNDSHAGALFHLFRAHWPPADAALNASKSLFKRRQYARVAGADERQNLIQIAQCLVRIDDLHLTAMLGNDRLDFLVRRKPPFPCSLEATVDALELLRRRVICAAFEARIDFERDCGELLLDLLGPGLGPPDRLDECF